MTSLKSRQYTDSCRVKEICCSTVSRLTSPEITGSTYTRASCGHTGGLGGAIASIQRVFNL